MLTPLILSPLSQDVRVEGSREGEGHASELTFLLTFWRRKSNFGRDPLPSCMWLPRQRKRNLQKQHHLWLHCTTPSKPYAFKCAMCNKSHSTDRCYNLAQYSDTERRKAGVYYRCLKKGHITRGCYETCKKCDRHHYNILCGVLLMHSQILKNDTKVLNFIK